jgi:hypothetical protein
MGHPMGAAGADYLSPSVATLELNKTFPRIDIVTHTFSGIFYSLLAICAVILAAIQHDCFAALMTKTF